MCSIHPHILPCTHLITYTLTQPKKPVTQASQAATGCNSEKILSRSQQYHLSFHLLSLHRCLSKSAQLKYVSKWLIDKKFASTWCSKQDEDKVYKAEEVAQAGDELAPEVLSTIKARGGRGIPQGPWQLMRTNLHNKIKEVLFPAVRTSKDGLEDAWVAVQQVLKRPAGVVAPEDAKTFVAFDTILVSICDVDSDEAWWKHGNLTFTDADVAVQNLGKPVSDTVVSDGPCFSDDDDVGSVPVPAGKAPSPTKQSAVPVPVLDFGKWTKDAGPFSPEFMRLCNAVLDAYPWDVAGLVRTDFKLSWNLIITLMASVETMRLSLTAPSVPAV